MTNEQAKALGQKMVDFFGIKCQSAARSGGYKTSHGKKTKVGIGHSVAGIVKQHVFGDATLEKQSD